MSYIWFLVTILPKSKQREKQAIKIWLYTKLCFQTLILLYTTVFFTPAIKPLVYIYLSTTTKLPFIEAGLNIVFTEAGTQIIDKMYFI